jgi:hypothetical protein
MTASFLISSCLLCYNYFSIWCFMVTAVYSVLKYTISNKVVKNCIGLLCIELTDLSVWLIYTCMWTFFLLSIDIFFSKLCHEEEFFPPKLFGGGGGLNPLNPAVRYSPYFTVLKTDEELQVGGKWWVRTEGTGEGV